jgi:hypothetical protein
MQKAWAVTEIYIKMYAFRSESLSIWKNLEDPKCRCEDNIKIDFKDMGCDCVDWIHLTQQRDHGKAYSDLTRRGIP